MSGSEALFGDPDFLVKLAHLDLVAKQVLSGALQGSRRSPKKGAGTIFKDYRSYSHGDDPRYVDWNVYGRLGSLFVKEFEVEEAAHVRIFLDRSLSMDFGTPSKLDFARKVAAALGYIGLSHYDRIGVFPLPGEEGRTFGGKSHAPALFDFLLSLEPGGETDLLTSVGRCLSGTRRRGLSILVSDLHDPRGFRPAVDFLLRRHHLVFLIQVVSLEEMDPVADGAMKLIDSETGKSRAVRIDRELLRRYRRAFRRFCAGVERYAYGKEIGYARLRTDVPFGEAMLTLLRTKGVVR